MDSLMWPIAIGESVVIVFISIICCAVAATTKNLSTISRAKIYQGSISIAGPVMPAVIFLMAQSDAPYSSKSEEPFWAPVLLMTGISIVCWIAFLKISQKNKEKRTTETLQEQAEEGKRHCAVGELVTVYCSMGYNDVVNGWISGSPNSANGVSVNFSIKNWSEKTIKYYTVYFIPYNAVGDPEKCSIRHESERGVRGVGPIPPLGSVTDCLFENAWYNPLIRSVRATKAVIEFTNGTTATVKL